jgi:hypothetical protein
MLTRALSTRLSDALAKERHWHKGEAAYVRFAALGGLHPVLVWEWATTPGDHVSVFDIRTGGAKWHRIGEIGVRWMFATPAFIVGRKKGNIRLLSIDTGAVDAPFADNYFAALIHPPYATASPALEAANRHLRPSYDELLRSGALSSNWPAFTTRKKGWPQAGAVEEAILADPFGWGIRLRVTNEWRANDAVRLTLGVYDEPPADTTP